MTSEPRAIHLKDYAPTPFAVEHVDLAVSLHPTDTRTTSRLSMASRVNHPSPLVLDGEGLHLHGIAIDGRALAADEYSYEGDKLAIHAPPNGKFALEIVQGCNPSANTALSGLYISNNIYCTQMEAEGFRRFAFSYDRPDVTTTYRVRLEADAALPVLLGNGNCLERGTVPGTNRHFAVWEDPHPKPTYLFALVAGDLASIHDTFLTSEGRTVSLGIYVEKGKEDACSWAMESLKASMAWDESRFGRAYDLDVLNIVAVSDFNFGAMENKGLNIFNDKYILARPEIATDSDYLNIERIIAHEYFHNWSGNRITCRDWFQLCLKEGLTVFRDQEFTSDLRSRPVKRIEDVRTLRARQFPEDQGPLAHPVRPSSYIEINNFYTATVYEKGAEICRMLFTLLGAATFRRAMDLYFLRHDGEAATIEDFIACMAEASNRDLTQFSRWYEQAGTPIVRVKEKYSAAESIYHLTLSQNTPPTPGQNDKRPLHLPFSYALLDDRGSELRTGLIELKAETETLAFRDIASKPHLSINRGFSAPVDLKEEASADELLFRMEHDTDSFNRWEAAQKLAMSLLVATAGTQGQIAPGSSIESFITALGATMLDEQLDDAFKALMLQLPSEAELTSALRQDVDAGIVQITRRNVRGLIGAGLRDELLGIMSRTVESGPYSPDMAGTSRRSLRYAALSLLALGDPGAALTHARAELAKPHSMTAEMGALSAIVSAGLREAGDELASFHARHGGEHLLVDKWFALHGSWPRADAASHVTEMMGHKDFRLTTPNRVYALLGSFCNGNLAGFHQEDGAGYELLADAVRTLDAINPQVAARMATSFHSWRHYDKRRRDMATSAMADILRTPKLSGDVFEIISRTLAASP